MPVMNFYDYIQALLDLFVFAGQLMVLASLIYFWPTAKKASK